jgi:6-phosphogluconolactonase
MAMNVVAANGTLDKALIETAQAIFAVCKAKKPSEPLTIGLCGGRSVVGLLGALHQESHNQPKDILGRLQFFMVDERLVPLTDEQSNYGGLKKLLFDRLISESVIAEDQLHPFVPDPSLADYGCAAYMRELEEYGGAFTVAVVGVGEDGHIAGLFPGHKTLEHQEHGFLTFHDSPKPPPDRMTASRPLLEASELAVVLLLGEGKRGAWTAFNRPESSVAACPALIAKGARSCLVVTDLT